MGGGAFLFHDATNLKTDSGILGKRLRSLKTKYTKTKNRKNDNKKQICGNVHNFKLRMA